MRFQTTMVSRWLRDALLDQVRRSTFPSGLFYPVCLAFAGGLLAAVDAGGEAPAFALNSSWLYRAEVGLAFMSAVYIAGMILWLAWHGRGFFELAAFGLTLKVSEVEKVDATVADLTGIGEKIDNFQGAAIADLDALNTRVSSLEDRADQ